MTATAFAPKEEDVMATSLSQNTNTVHGSNIDPSMASYDFTVFIPEDVFFIPEGKDTSNNVLFDGEPLEEEGSGAVQDERVREDMKKQEEEGLLGSESVGRNDEQMARIASYYNRIEDSDSEDDCEDGNEQEDDKCLEEEKTNCPSNAYSGLGNEEEGDDNDDVKAGETETALTNTIDTSSDVGGEQEYQQSVDADTLQLNVASSKLGRLELGNDASPLQTSTTTEMEQDRKIDAFSKAIPLLKPPPFEKMQAYLMSKGLVKKKSNLNTTGEIEGIKTSNCSEN